ncbi:hypothetical protein LTR27_006274 [Elasticomyces elasticus]|nr:hypothetical protein LTR27_006274 [Elasticomyces elasticus]
MPVVSRLLALPAELRNFIYELAFEGSVSIGGRQAGIVRACRQTREESLLLFYNLSRFVFRSQLAGYHMTCCPELRAWLTAIGKANAEQLRHLRFKHEYSWKINKHGDDVMPIYDYLDIAVHDDATRSIAWTFSYEDAEGLNIVEEGKPWPYEGDGREAQVLVILEQAAGLPDGTYC